MNQVFSMFKPAEAGIAQTTKAMEDLSKRMGYLVKVGITEFDTKRVDIYLDKNIPSVRVALKYIGDRSLDMVKVTVYFKDKDDNLIFEEGFHPVFVSEYSYGAANKPLKPGYVRELKKVSITPLNRSYPSGRGGKAVAKIVDTKFSE